MHSPFQFQLPLPPEDVHGRDELLAALTEQVTDRRITALLGPRRFGKTSVLRRLADDLTEISTVWLDVYGVQSLADIATRLDEALVRAPAAFRTEANHVAARVQVTLGVVRAEFARPRRSQPDPSARLGQLLEVFLDAAARRPALLVIDEFSDIGRVRGAAETLRTAFQHRASDFGLVVAGSHVSAMRQMFAGREQPFYGQAELLEIGPLDAVTVAAIVADGFAATGRDPGNVASRVHHVALGHPQRTMLLADAAWTHAADGPADEQWGSALAEVRARLDGSMRTVHDTLTVSERRVLRLLAHDEPLFGTVSDQLGLTSGAAQSAVKQLVDHGHVTTGTPRTVTDPLLADWFRLTLPL
ncbi:MAG: AAA family ATPase [Nitriliruptoraceae bacterium]|nr:AAA family ATPase [Nitriliruptoraceae bacterium]